MIWASAIVEMGRWGILVMDDLPDELSDFEAGPVHLSKFFHIFGKYSKLYYYDVCFDRDITRAFHFRSRSYLTAYF